MSSIFAISSTLRRRRGAWTARFARFARRDSADADANASFASLTFYVSSLMRRGRLWVVASMDGEVGSTDARNRFLVRRFHEGVSALRERPLRRALRTTLLRVVHSNIRALEFTLCGISR